MNVITPGKLMLTAALALSVTSAAMAGKMIDNFESYKGGQVIGKTYNSMPWCRFGAATNDNVLATDRSTKVIEGRLSAQYGVFWPNTFGAVRYGYDRPTDLSAHSLVAVKMKSDNSATKTRVKFAITNGQTTYASRSFKTLTDKVQTLVFEVGAGELELIDGADSYETVIKTAMSLGFNFQSPEGQYIETIMFDDLMFATEEDVAGSAE